MDETNTGVMFGRQGHEDLKTCEESTREGHQI